MQWASKITEVEVEVGKQKLFKQDNRGGKQKIGEGNGNPFQ